MIKEFIEREVVIEAIMSEPLKYYRSCVKNVRCCRVQSKIK